LVANNRSARGEKKNTEMVAGREVFFEPEKKKKFPSRGKLPLRKRARRKGGKEEKGLLAYHGGEKKKKRRKVRSWLGGKKSLESPWPRKKN